TGLSEDVGVGAGPGEINRLVVEAVNQEPVGPDMAIAEAFPLPLERVVAMASVEGIVKAKRLGDIPQRLQVEPSLAEPLEIALERPGRDDVPRPWPFGSRHRLKAPASRAASRCPCTSRGRGLAGRRASPAESPRWGWPARMAGPFAGPPACKRPGSP